MGEHGTYEGWRAGHTATVVQICRRLTTLLQFTEESSLLNSWFVYVGFLTFFSTAVKLYQSVHVDVDVDVDIKVDVSVDVPTSC